MERRKHDSTMKRMMRDLKEGAADALGMISSYRFRESVNIDIGFRNVITTIVVERIGRPQHIR